MKAHEQYDQILNDTAVQNGHRPEIFTAANLMALELPPPNWAVPGIVPEGVVLLAGKPKLGKSWMALGLAVAVATGGVALGTRRVEQGERASISRWRTTSADSRRGSARCWERLLPRRGYTSPCNGPVWMRAARRRSTPFLVVIPTRGSWLWTR